MPRMTSAEYQIQLAKEDARQVKDVRAKLDSKQRESELHDQILDECRRRGWAVIHARMDRPTTSGVGSPDFVIAAEYGITFWVEAKTARGKLTSEQTMWLAWLRKLGHRAVVVRSLQEFILALTFGEGPPN